MQLRYFAGLPYIALLAQLYGRWRMGLLRW